MRIAGPPCPVLPPLCVAPAQTPPPAPTPRLLIFPSQAPESDYLDAALITVMQIHLSEPEGGGVVPLLSYPLPAGSAADSQQELRKG